MIKISEKESFWQQKSKKQKKEIVVNTILVIFVVFFAFGLMPLLRVTLNNNYPLVVVSSGSMEPNIYKGDIVIIKWKDPKDIEVGSHTDWTGDILLYDSTGLISTPDNQPVIHRVVGKEYNAVEEQYYFVTHGDANFGIDLNKVPEESVIGVYAGKIPKIGWVKVWMSDYPLIFGGFIGIVAIALIISMVYDHSKNSKNAEISKNAPTPEKIPQNTLKEEN